MKRNLIALAFVLFSGSVLLASAQTSPGGRTQSPGNRSQFPDGSMVISEYGTLLDVRDSNGQSIRGRVEHDGYKVTYGIGGNSRSASAFGSKNATGLLPGQVKLTGNTAMVRVTTADKLLEITSLFTLDPVKNTLSIRRTFKNISGERLKLLETRQFVPLELFGVTGSTSRQDLKHLVEQLIRGAQDCEAGECTEPPKICTTTGLCPSSSLSFDDKPDIPDTTLVGTEVLLAECPCECPKQDASASPTSAATPGECPCKCPKTEKRPANESSVVVQIAMKPRRLK